MTITTETTAELRKILFGDSDLNDVQVLNLLMDNLGQLLDAATECLELREERERQRKDPLLALYDRVCIANAEIRQQLSAMTKERDEAVARGDRWYNLAASFYDEGTTVNNCGLFHELNAAETPGEKEGA